MIVQAAGLALLASISPTALLLVSIYLGSARPRVSALCYLAGAVAMSLVMGTIILVALRSADLSRQSEHTPRYGFRLGLGLALLVLGLVLAVRAPRTSDPGDSHRSLVYRMAAEPTPLSAFLVGVLIFAPGATFLAALQVIATSRARLPLTLFAIIVVVVINTILVWMPIVLYMAAPQTATRILDHFNAWLLIHGKRVLVYVVFVVGGIMVANGIYGLVVSH